MKHCQMANSLDEDLSFGMALPKSITRIVGVCRHFEVFGFDVDRDELAVELRL